MRALRRAGAMAACGWTCAGGRAQPAGCRPTRVHGDGRGLAGGATSCASVPRAAGAAPRNELAYKTGTSYGHRDAWAVGFDGRYVVGVWMGRADGTPVPGAFGGDLAAPVMFAAFQRIGRRRSPCPPPPPATLLVANAELPRPLQRFDGRGAEVAAGAPQIAFPPDGAVVEGAALMVRVRDGAGPFTWLANGGAGGGDAPEGGAARRAGAGVFGPHGDRPGRAVGPGGGGVAGAVGGRWGGTPSYGVVRSEAEFPGRQADAGLKPRPTGRSGRIGRSRAEGDRASGGG